MSVKRTNVYADPEDLAITKEAAERRGTSEAETIRQGIHLTAMANRVWEESLSVASPHPHTGLARHPPGGRVNVTELLNDL